MARKRKRRTAAAAVAVVTTKSSSPKLAAKEAGKATTSPSFSTKIPVSPLSPTSKKKFNSEAVAKVLTGDKEERNLRTTSVKNQAKKQEMEVENQIPISTTTAASCRRKQAKPQRKNGESHYTYKHKEWYNAWPQFTIIH